MIIGIPATTDGLGELLHARLSYGNEGTGSLWLNNVVEVSDMNKASIINAKHAAEWLAGRTLNRDATIEILSRRQTLEGRSWELMVTLGLCSLLTGIPLNPWLTASGRVGENGTILPISSLKEKLEAARASGFNTFLVSKEQEWEPMLGIEIYPVSNIKQAWSIASARIAV